MGAMCKQQLKDMQNYTGKNTLGNKIQGTVKKQAYQKAAQNIEVENAQKFEFVYDTEHVTGKNFGFDQSERTVEKLTNGHEQFVPKNELGKKKTYFNLQILRIQSDIYFGIQSEESKNKSGFHTHKQTVHYNCRHGDIRFAGSALKNQIQKNPCQEGDIVTIILDLESLKLEFRKNGISILDQPITLPMKFREQQWFIGVQMYRASDKIKLLS